jgi:hypothetical protein
MTPMQSQSSSPHRLIVMPFKRLICKQTSSFLFQLFMDDVEDIVAPPLTTMSEEFIDAFQPLPSGLPQKNEMNP